MKYAYAFCSLWADDVRFHGFYTLRGKVRRYKRVWIKAFKNSSLFKARKYHSVPESKSIG